MSCVSVLAVPSLASGKTLTYPSSKCPKSSGSGTGSGLQKCINKAATGDTVLVKPGKYYEQNIHVAKRVIVSGTPAANAQPNSCGSPPPTVIDAGVGGANASAGDGFDIGAAGVTVRCLTVRHTGGSNYGINNFTTPFANLTVTEVWIVDSDYGIYQGAANGLRVTNSTVLGTASYGIYQAGTSNGDLLAGNRLASIDSDAVYFGTTSGSAFKGNSIGPATSDGIYISGGSGNLVSGNSLHTIESDCIEFYSTRTTITGNTLNVCDSTGIYTSVNSAKITKNVFNGKVDGDAIEVNCSNNTLISGNKQNVSSGTDDDPFVYACNTSGSSITITNNTVLGFNSYAVECSTCYRATISGNRATDGSEDYGIYFSGAHPLIDKNTMTGGWDTEGLYVYCSSVCAGSSVSGNVEAQCSDGCTGYYIKTVGCTVRPCMTISGNTATSNLAYGFDLEVSYSKISGNTANGNGYTYAGCDYAGFYFGGSGQNSVSGNKANGNACQGFAVDESNDTFTKNSASGNVAHGFEVENSTYSGNTFNLNTSTNNFGDGFNNDGTATRFLGNTASGNRQDCTSDGSESATLGTVSGNHCADGSIFTHESNLTGW